MPSKASIFGILFNKEPEEIVRWFEKKGTRISWNWQEVWKQANAKAFTVAKVMKEDLLKDIRTTVQESIKTGMSFYQFRESLEPTLKKQGWWGKVKAKDVPGYDPESNIDPEKPVQLGSPHRLKTIYRTNIDVAYSTGKFKTMSANTANRPYWQYSAVLDGRTRPSHRAMHGKVFRFDDPIWKTHFPPNGWGCRCEVIPLDDDDLKELKLKPETNSAPFKDQVRIDKGWDYNPGAQDAQ